jgi:hypothetical protein
MRTFDVYINQGVNGWTWIFSLVGYDWRKTTELVLANCSDPEGLRVALVER